MILCRYLDSIILFCSINETCLIINYKQFIFTTYYLIPKVNLNIYSHLQINILKNMFKHFKLNRLIRIIIILQLVYLKC